MSIKKAIITAAGLGTRLLSATKEMPKEMLPLFVKNHNGEITLKPVLQLLFEQLHDTGFREFCFVVGRGKRSVEDHFTPDYGYVELLLRKGKAEKARELETFYAKLESSTIMWINQPEPKGFGHAVLVAKPFLADEPFIVCAGDTYVISSNHKFIHRMVKVHLKENPKATLLLEKRQDPRTYGVVLTLSIDANIHRVLRIVEKPKVPPSNLATVPFYIFDPLIMEALKNIGPRVGGEIQLTDAIQRLIDDGYRVYATALEEGEERLDVGTPETYWHAIKASYERLKEDNRSPRKSHSIR